MADKIPEHILKKAIADKFGNMTRLAEKMGVTLGYVSRSAVDQNSTFMKRLEKAGLKLNDVRRMIEDETKDERMQISKLEKRIAELENLLKDKDAIIKHQNIFLEQYKLMLNKKGAGK